MRKMISASVFLVCVVWMSSVVAQSPGAKPGPLVLNPIAASSGTGVSNVALLDRPEVRVLRVDVQPGGVRNVHTHDDTLFHLFIPVSGGARFEVEPDKPVDLATWQAQFIKGGTRHGFKNTGTTTATVIEVFVKKPLP
jgi:quercetin dioxygenase-like cupin family protein